LKLCKMGIWLNIIKINPRMYLVGEVSPCFQPAQTRGLPAPPPGCGRVPAAARFTPLLGAPAERVVDRKSGYYNLFPSPRGRGAWGEVIEKTPKHRLPKFRMLNSCSGYPGNRVLQGCAQRREWACNRWYPAAPAQRTRYILILLLCQTQIKTQISISPDRKKQTQLCRPGNLSKFHQI